MAQGCRGCRGQRQQEWFCQRPGEPGGAGPGSCAAGSLEASQLATLEVSAVPSGRVPRGVPVCTARSVPPTPPALTAPAPRSGAQMPGSALRCSAGSGDRRGSGCSARPGRPLACATKSSCPALKLGRRTRAPGRPAQRAVPARPLPALAGPPAPTFAGGGRGTGGDGEEQRQRGRPGHGPRRGGGRGSPPGRAPAGAGAGRSAQPSRAGGTFTLLLAYTQASCMGGGSELPVTAQKPMGFPGFREPPL